MFHSLGQPNVRITPDRIQCGRYGLNVGDVEQVVQAAIGGQAITQVYEGEKHFDLTVRWMPAFRKDLQTIRNILVATPDGNQVPLGQLAQIVEEEGPSLVYREDLRRYTPVKFSVRGRDLASTIAEAQEKIAEKVKLPYDTHLEWAGEINQLNETTGRLMIIIPLTLLLIAFLVYSSVKNWKDMVVVLAGIPCACSGGVVALLVTHTTFSISAAMGFISIFGVAIQDALIVVPYAQRLVERRRRPRGGRAARRRARPAPGAHDHVRGHDRPSAGGAVARHRLGDAEAARHRGHRRRAHAGDPAAPVAAGADGAPAPPRAALGRTGPRPAKSPGVM